MQSSIQLPPAEKVLPAMDAKPKRATRRAEERIFAKEGIRNKRVWGEVVRG